MGFDRMRARFAAGLAAVALVLQIVVPPGFMPAWTDSGLSTVICTGHGPLLAHSDEHGKPGKAPARGEGGVCVFAGHGGVAPAPAPHDLSQARVVVVVGPATPSRDLLPGRGLAAPPPPSQGPPIRLI
jgi:hypothetical protein